MIDGWVKIHRKIIDSAVFSDSVLLHVLVYCLITASYAERTALYGRKEFILKPGQFFTSRSKIAAATSMSEKMARNALKSLYDLDIIKLETSQGQAGTLITVCHWRSYQIDDVGNCEVRAKWGPSEGQVRAKLPYNKELEEGKEGKERKEKREENEFEIPDDHFTLQFDPQTLALSDYWKSLGQTLDVRSRDGIRSLVALGQPTEEVKATIDAFLAAKAKDRKKANPGWIANCTLKGLANGHYDDFRGKAKEKATAKKVAEAKPVGPVRCPQCGRNSIEEIGAEITCFGNKGTCKAKFIAEYDSG